MAGRGHSDQVRFYAFLFKPFAHRLFISFRLEEDENCALQVYYAAGSGDFLRVVVICHKEIKSTRYAITEKSIVLKMKI